MFRMTTLVGLSFSFLFFLAAVLLPGCAPEQPEHRVTLEAEPAGAGEVSGSGTYLEGEEVTVEADPGEEYEFKNWLEDGEKVSSQQQYALEITGEKKLIAEFEQKEEAVEEDKYELTVKASDDARGSVDGSGVYPEGKEVTITAQAQEGYHFLFWERDGMMRGPDKELEVQAHDDKEFIAHFGMDAVEGVMPPEFVFDLYQEMADPGENMFMSPVSIYLALTLAYNGADGETRQEIGELLRAAEMDLDSFNEKCANFREFLEAGSDGVELSIADSLWLEEGVEFSEDYLDTLDRYHGAEARELDFASPAAPAEINQWVSEETEEMIEELFGEDQPLPAQYFILLNAIYFQGQWLEDFDPEKTEEKEFTLHDGSTTEVPMMQRESEDIDEYQHLAGNGFEAVRIPYGGEVTDPYGDGTRMGMYVFVPDYSLEDFYGQLNAENWAEWMDNFHSKEGIIGLPRFEIEHEELLREHLTELGMEKSFQDRADFGGMSPQGDGFFLDEIKHKAVIEVDEKGTEAAAVTAALGMGDGPEPFEVIADRPFFFVIRDDEAESILFAGALVDPS